MKILKEKRKVAITLNDGVVIKGLIHINEGERLSDCLNDTRESFIPLTETVDTPVSPKTLLLNKSFIKLVEEL